LEDDTLTPYWYGERLSFCTSNVSLSAEDHRATLGDLADYALRMIYDVDARYRSCYPKEHKDRAIARWFRIVHGADRNNQRDRVWGKKQLDFLLDRSATSRPAQR
jgi:hypothetical protein